MLFISLPVVEQHFKHWPKNAPICVHAEKRTVAAVLWLADLYSRSVHFCHVARREEVIGCLLAVLIICNLLIVASFGRSC